MGNLKRVICRLCLRKCVDFEAVEDHTKDVLEILLLKMNLAISEEPVMCTNCAAMLMKCFDFKATCFYTHDYIVPFLDDEKISKLDLKKVYMSKYENVDIPEDHGVCGFCMRLLKKYAAMSLDSKEGGVMLQKLIGKYLPELDLSTIEAPMICAPCYESLQACSHFVTSCLIVEEKITEYRKLTGADVIEIADVLRSTSINVVKEGGNMEKKKILPKENVEEKTKQHDFDICLDGVVSPQPVTIKLRGRRKCSTLKRGPLNSTNKHKSAHKNISETAHKAPSQIKMHQCDSCSFQTKYKSSIQDHMITHKLFSETTMYQCDSCNFKTQHKRSLREHALIHKDHSETKMYRCDFCEFKTKHKGSQRRHIKTHKDHSETKMYRCDFCEFKTKHKGSQRRHIKTHKDHSETTMYQCHFCELKTGRKDSLQRHMLMHSDHLKIEMHCCDSCNFKTQHKRNLQRHMLTHKDHSIKTM